MPEQSWSEFAGRLTELALRKGAPEPDRDLFADLGYLAQHGALAGVAEVIRERRRQIEELGYSVEHDDSREDGELMGYLDQTVTEAEYGVAELSEGPEYAEEKMRQAGALAAAEIDRLSRLLAGSGLPRRVPGAALTDQDRARIAGRADDGQD